VDVAADFQVVDFGLLQTVMELELASVDVNLKRGALTTC
jgi:hypothetical protein